MPGSMTPRHLATLSAIACTGLLVACSQAPGAPDASAADGSADRDGDALGDVADVPVDVPVDVPSDTPLDQPGDIPADAPMGTCPGTLPTGTASRQTVRFHFVPGAAPALQGYVATAGFMCSEYGLERVSGTSTSPVILGLPYQCICECPAPPPAGVATAQAIGQTETIVTWDAREVHSCSTVVDCGMRGWPGAGFQFEEHAYSEPVAAWRFRATFAVLDPTLPSNCTVGGGGVVTCSQPAPMGSSGVFAYNVCPGARTMQVDFDLPATGDVDVNVQLP